MFNEIKNVESSWIKLQESFLVDIGLVLQHLFPKQSEDFSSALQKIQALEAEKKAAIIKDPVFFFWLNDLNNKLLRSIEEESIAFDRLTLEKGIGSINSSYSILTGKAKVSSTLYSSILPGTRHIVQDSRAIPLAGDNSISIVGKDIFPFFEDKDSVGVEFDFTIDEGEWQKALEEAIRLVKISPQSWYLVRSFVSYIAPLKQKEEVRNLSYSTRNLPGVVFKNNENSPLIFAETLVHEADHQFYYAAENLSSFWTKDPIQQLPVFYSPWRDDPRPLDGILRGLSAFCRVQEFYCELLRKNELSPGYIGPNATFRLIQCQNALITLSDQSALSLAGQKYLLQLKNLLFSCERVLKGYSEFDKWLGVSERKVEDHQKKWKVNNATIDHQ